MPRKRAVNGSGLQPRKRSDGRWECSVTIGIDPGTGKTISKYIYGKNAEECSKKQRAIAAEIDAGSYHEPPKMLLKEWLGIWYNEYCINVKKSTKKAYETQLRVHIVPLLGAIRLRDLQAHHIQQFINTLSKGGKKVSPVSAKTVKDNFGTLHRALQQAVMVGYLKSNPADGCTLPRSKKPEIKPLNDADIRRFLAAIHGHKNERAFIVDLFTGLRKSELIGLTWDCIDFEAGTVRVYRQLQLLSGEYSFHSLKNDRPRTLYPTKFVMNALREQKRAQAELRLKAGAVWSNPDNFVFTDETGKHLLHQTLYKQFKRIVRELGLPAARFHDLRHSYAVAALKYGDDVKTVQENLGHATAAFTLDVYGHATDEMKRASSLRMDAAIESILGR